MIREAGEAADIAKRDSPSNSADRGMALFSGNNHYRGQPQILEATRRTKKIQPDASATKWKARHADEAIVAEVIVQKNLTGNVAGINVGRPSR